MSDWQYSMTLAQIYKGRTSSNKNISSPNASYHGNPDLKENKVIDRSVVARGQRWGRQGGHEEIGGGVPEMFYIVSMVELMLLCAFAKTEIAA